MIELRKLRISIWKHLRTHLLQRCVAGAVMLEGGVVLPGVVRHQEGPAPEVALVAVAAVKHVTVEEQRVT